MSGTRILPAAFEDLATAVTWYDAKGDDLGNEFAKTFFAEVEKIEKNPLTSRLVYHEFRRKMLRRFPYAVYYRLHGEQIVIALLFHTARNPKVLRQLLRNREKTK